MSGRPDWKSADELMAELEQKPEFVKRQQDRSAQREENRRRYTEAAEEILRDLRAAGFSVESVAQLRQRGVGNVRALPALLEWLPKVTYLPLKRDLIATLGSVWGGRDAARALVEEFRRVPPDDDTADSSVRWSIGDSLERVADEAVVDDLMAIAADKRHGRHRGLVVTALGNMAKERDRVLPLLLALLDDSDVAAYAVMGLGKLKAPEGRPAVERFLDHPEAWVRDEAEKALAKIPS